jgi:hypothetical protein
MTVNFGSRIAWAGLAAQLLASYACNAEEAPAPPLGGANTAANDFNLWLTPGILSHHYDRNAGYRERNWGFGIQSSLSGSFSVMAGNYINSDNVRSDYAGVIWQPWSWRSVKIGLAAAVFNGYPLMRGGGWFPAALPLISIRNERVGANFTVIPNYPARGLHGSIAAQFILRVW